MSGSIHSVRLVVALLTLAAMNPLPAGPDLSKYEIPDGFRLAIGTNLPSFSLRRTDGAIFETQVTDARPTLIAFFTSACAPCLHEVPALNTFKKLHPEIQVLVLTPDRIDEARAVTRRTGLKWPVLVDDEKLLDSWGVLAFPSFMLTGADRKILSVTYGNRLGTADGYATADGIAKWVGTYIPAELSQ